MRPPHLDTTTRVETPEHIAFEFRLAGPWRRGVAYFIDFIVRITAFFLLAMFLLLTSAFSPFEELSQTPMAALLLLYFVAEWFYFVLFEWLWSGLTPGKKALGLRVVRDGGLPVTLPDALLRNLLRAADLLPPLGPLPTYLVGALVSASDHRFRRLGDLAAGTFVVVEEPSRLQAPAPVEPPPTPDELRALPAHLRLKVEERKTLDAFMRRWSSLHPARREEVCETYAPHLARRLGLPPPESGARFLQLVYARLTEADRVPRRRR